MDPKFSNSFHSALISQYRELVHEAVLESDHKLYLDTPLFEKKLNEIKNAAVLDGLSENEIIQLFEEAKQTAPTHAKAG